MTEQKNGVLGVNEDDPGGILFYGEIAEMFRRMNGEKLPQQDKKTTQCGLLLGRIMERYGIAVVLTTLAELLAEQSNSCPHIEWLSSNFNVLVNRAIEHNQEKYGFPFGL